ncbi:PTS fructose transporter subunit IIB [Escherichia coli]
MTKIIAVTACPSGVAHTYMAAEALESAESERLGSESRNPGVNWSENELTAEDVASADMVILTKDIGIKFEERFEGRPSCASTSAMRLNALMPL